LTAALGRRTALTRPNGVTTSYSYDTLSRLLQALHQKGSTLVEGVAYSYDAAGNRLTRAETTPGRHGNTTKTDAFSYDAIYQLTQAATDGNTTDLDTYDAVGNRLTDWFGGTYNYNSSNELASYPVFQYTWTYDNNGNTTSETVGSSVTSFAWDYENRMTSVVLPGTGGTVNFKYDPFGRRIYKSSSAGTTIFAYDGDNRIEDLSSTGTATARYTQGLGIDEPLEVYEGGAGILMDSRLHGNDEPMDSGRSWRKRSRPAPRPTLISATTPLEACRTPARRSPTPSASPAASGMQKPGFITTAPGIMIPFSEGSSARTRLGSTQALTFTLTSKMIPRPSSILLGFRAVRTTPRWLQNEMQARRFMSDNSRQKMGSKQDYRVTHRLG
jgi:YD repeat-containing protein